MDIKEYRSIDTLKEWDKNPRSINAKDFDRLKKQIFNLGQYKPLIITEDGTILGGIMRIKAYRELGIKDVWISVVKADTEEKKLEYALSDNDRAGFYDEDLLANLTGEFPEFNWDDFAVDMGQPLNIKELLEKHNINFDDIQSTEDREKQFKNMTVTCPDCGKSFEIQI